MTSEITTFDPAAALLREKLAQKWRSNAPVLVMEDAPESTLASTIILAKRYGGTGTSTLALVLEFLMRQEALIIEVGGNRCPMFRGRGEDLHAHFPMSYGNRINDAMDLRLAHPGRVAILEFEPTLYTETLRIAKNMITLDAGLIPTVFYVCARHEADPLYAKNALASKIDQTFICQEAVQNPAAHGAGKLILPWLDRSIMKILWAGAGNLQTALEQCRGSWTLQETRLNLEQFYKTLVADR